MIEPPSALNVLIVDDDVDSRMLATRTLEGAGFVCGQAEHVEQAKSVLSSQPIDILLTDIHLPGPSGLDLVKWVREQGLTCEVIIFTAYPRVETAIEALRAGAADYLSWPVSHASLLEALDRVAQRLIQRRQKDRAALVLLQESLQRMTARTSLTVAAAGNDARLFRVGPVLLDVDRFAIEVNGERIDATPSELEILYHLFRHAGRVVTAQELIQSVRGYRAEPSEASEIIRPHISNLRRKLSAIDPAADVVQTVRGVGYMLKAPSRTDA